jgi:hypothetical protein
VIHLPSPGECRIGRDGSAAQIVDQRLGRLPAAVSVAGSNDEPDDPK